jgi:hypothetical protein
LQIPEADLEYLIRTLSDARSRATELAVSLGSRLGSAHRLTELASAAALDIENTLREVRNTAAATSESGSGLADLQTALHSVAQPAESFSENHAHPAPVAFSAQSGLDSEHWLSLFIDELMAKARGAGGITFESTERLLQQRKDEFLRDFLTARRMYRTYPRLFPELEGGQQT